MILFFVSLTVLMGIIAEVHDIDDKRVRQIHTLGLETEEMRDSAMEKINSGISDEEKYKEYEKVLVKKKKLFELVETMYDDYAKEKKYGNARYAYVCHVLDEINKLDKYVNRTIDVRLKKMEAVFKDIVRANEIMQCEKLYRNLGIFDLQDLYEFENTTLEKDDMKFYSFEI
uniref:Uncharacterized protein n=1 Tax=Clastoptera arizonana TaxID=38151 RepID=A0A1B6CX46_9HEMI